MIPVYWDNQRHRKGAGVSDPGLQQCYITDARPKFGNYCGCVRQVSVLRRYMLKYLSERS